MNMPQGGTPRGQKMKPANLTLYPIISRNEAIQDRYNRLRYAGESHSIAEMLACQQAPGAMTDRELTMGVGTLDKQLSRDDKRFLEEDVRRNGNPPNPNSVYQPQLAERPFDRKAFVTGGADIRDRCEELGVGCEGFVNVKSPGSRLERDPLEGSGKVAADLVQMISKQRVGRNPSLKGMDMTDEIHSVHGTNLHKPR